MTVKYFNVKNGLTAGTITLDADTGNTTSTNLTVTGKSNLGAVANLTITGGSPGYLLTTDGFGGVSFESPPISSFPTLIPYGTTLTVEAGTQAYFGYPITIDGTLVVDGVLIDINDATVPVGVTGSIQFNDGNNTVGGDANLTYVPGTGTLTVPTVVVNTVIRTTPTTVTGLPSAISVGAGSRAYVTDCLSKGFLDRVYGGGSNAVPVVSDGTNWYVG